MTRRRMAWYGAALLLTGIAAWWLFRPERMEVESAEATVAPLAETVGDEGMTRVRDRYLVTAPVAGRVERIGLEPGDAVARGALVARLAPLSLDPRGREQAEAALRAAVERTRAADAGLGQARVALEQARRDVGRAEPLLAAGGISRAEVERLQAVAASREREVEAAQFLARAARQDAATARAALEGARGEDAGAAAIELRSPVQGQVLAVPERSGRAVAAGDLLLELGDPSKLEVVVDLLSTDAVRVRPGDPILVGGWGGGADSALCGTVRRVEPSGFTKVSALGVEEQRVNLVGDIEEPPPGLGDRFRVEVRVVLWQGDRVLQVPSSAVFRRGGDWAVFVIQDGRARERIVRVGHGSGTALEILEGLTAGDAVIRHPTDRIEDGVRVRVASR